MSGRVCDSWEGVDVRVVIYSTGLYHTKLIFKTFPIEKVLMQSWVWL